MELNQCHWKNKINADFNRLRGMWVYDNIKGGGVVAWNYGGCLIIPQKGLLINNSSVFVYNTPIIHPNIYALNTMIFSEIQKSNLKVLLRLVEQNTCLV